MSDLAIPISKAIGQATLRIRVKGVRIATLRIKFGVWLLGIAARIIGTQVEITMGGDDFDELPPAGTRSYDLIGGMEVPRQLSIRHGSPLYVSNFYDVGQKIDVYLDGVKQDTVVSYDADAGYVRVNRTNEKGEFFVAGDEIATEIKRGRVELRPKS
jgi:hypothetical protein